MFKSKPLNKAPQQLQPQNISKAKIFSQREDLTLQLKHLKLSEEPNFESLMKNIPSIKKRNKFEVASPLTAKLGEVENVEMEMENIEKLLNNDEIYDILYGQTYEKQLYTNEPDLQGMLKAHQIRDPLRAKMADWMLEVFANYNETSNTNTYFKAVTIMDFYFKKSKKSLKDSDVHISGVAAMFLASKFEDIYHIPMQDFLERVAHNKFSAMEIKSKEWEIVSTLNFDISFPSCYTFYRRYFWKSFSWNQSNSDYTKSLEDVGTYILKMMVYNSNLMRYKAHILGLTALFLGLNTLFEELMVKNKIHKDVLRKNLIEIKEGVLNLNPTVDRNELEKCLIETGNYIIHFEEAYPGYNNYQKYHLELDNCNTKPN